MTDSAPIPVGLVSGPGDTSHTFTLVAFDAAQALRIGEFITYAIRLEDQPREVLARIVNRQPLRRYPLSFLVDPALVPAAIAETVGYRGKASEALELTAETISYYDPLLIDSSIPGCRRPPASRSLPLAMAA